MSGTLSSVETEEKQDAGLFLFGCSEMTSAWLITSKLAYQNAWKALFAWVVYTNYQSLDGLCTMYINK